MAISHRQSAFGEKTIHPFDFQWFIQKFKYKFCTNI